MTLYSHGSLHKICESITREEQASEPGILLSLKAVLAPPTASALYFLKRVNGKECRDAKKGSYSFPELSRMALVDLLSSSSKRPKCYWELTRDHLPDTVYSQMKQTIINIYLFIYSNWLEHHPMYRDLRVRLK